MNKIRTKADALAVAKKLVASDSMLVLWDNIKENRVALRDSTYHSDTRYKIALMNTVNGDGWYELLSIYGVAEIIWHNRKFINQSGQLATFIGG